jgi:signal transduction histidine kinase/ligand-binding sensor domain-containing protein/FixJ family two-component response regulator
MQPCKFPKQPVMIAKYGIKFLAGVLLSTGTFAASGQIKCKIEHYSTQDGLSHNVVTSIIRDHEGFMWFSTKDGIDRYDGHGFITYKSRPGDHSDLKNNWIDEMVEDRTGLLWIKSHDNQLYTFNKKTEKFFDVSEQLSTAKTGKINFDRVLSFDNNGVWLTTNDQGVFYIQNSQQASFKYTRYSSDQASIFKLPTDQINFLYQDKARHIWIGTPKGLCYLEKDETEVYKRKDIRPDLLLDLNITCITEDNENIRMGTGQGFLISYEKSSQKMIRKKITDYSINAVTISRKTHSVYLSTSGSEFLTVAINDLRVSSSTMQNGGPFFSIYEDKTGLLWIEPKKQGVIKFDPTNRTFKYYAFEDRSNKVSTTKNYAVFEDNSDRVWLHSKGGGFGYYDAAKDSAEELFTNVGCYNYSNPDGVLWLCNDGRGITKIILQYNSFDIKQVLEKSSNKFDNTIGGICNDYKNRFWLGTKTGKLYVYQNGIKADIEFVNQPKNGFGPISTILQDSKGAIWLGTLGNGLYMAQPTDQSETKYKLSQYKADKNDIHSLSSDNIYTLLEDRQGRIWAGAFPGGLNRVVQTNNRIEFFNCKNAFSNYPKNAFNNIRHMEQDASNNIWLGTTDGLLIFNPETGTDQNYRFVSYNKIPDEKESLGNNDVQYIYRDTKNMMWVATSGGGLNEAVGTNPLKSLKFKIFTTKDGLPSDYIKSMIQDRGGNLWLSTENGLSRLSATDNHFTNYDEYDGLPQVNFSESSSAESRDGNLLFGLDKGYLVFDPAKIADHLIAAPMVLTHLQINAKEVVPDENNPVLKTNMSNANHLVLTHDESTISIVYTVLDFRSTNKPLYAYRLTGIDNEWNYNGLSRRSIYTNLPTGHYTFEVKSTSTNLYANVPYKAISIIIKPAWWRTTWAYLLYFILLIIILEVVRRYTFTVIKLRNRIVIEQRLSDLKMNFLTNISHELRTPLTLILNPIEQLYKQETLTAQGKEYIHIVQKNANRMMRFINQLLDLRKVQSGKAELRISQVEMISLVKMIGSYFIETAREKNIRLLIVSAADKLYAWIDIEKIDIVIYNLLANAFKFTSDGKTIKVELKQFEHELVIEVTDQGVGVPDDQLAHIFELYYEINKGEGNYQKGTGIGLALSKELVTLHHGEIIAKNNANGIGLSVTIRLPLGKDHFKHDAIRLADTSENISQKDYLELSLQDEPDTKTDNSTNDEQLILLVEDNHDLSRFLTTQLSKIYKVECAGNGEEGLEKALQLLPDLILSDVMMPKIDGIMMLDRLKNNPATSHIPVILLTARFSVEDQVEGLKYGADDYITKPFDNNILLASIGNLIRQRRKIFDALAEKKTIELSPSGVIITAKDEVFLKDVISFVESRMIDPKFNIDEVAVSFGMGRTTFFRKFKSLTNMAPVEFVRDMRLKRGKQLLDAGENNVSIAAYTSGFHNAKYFSTCFKEKYKTSPAAYLKTMKADNRQK